MELIISIAVNLLLGASLAALFYWTGRRDGVRLASADAALETFKRLLPDAAGGVATLSADGRSALIELAHGAGIGLLQRHGRRWNARILQPGELTAARTDPDGAIKLAFADFGWPRATVQISDAIVRGRWLARLQSLAEQRSAAAPPDLRHA